MESRHVRYVCPPDKQVRRREEFGLATIPENPYPYATGGPSFLSGTKGDRRILSPNQCMDVVI